MGRECVLVPYVHLKDVYNCHGDDDGRPTALISLFNKKENSQTIQKYQQGHRGL